MNQAKVFDQQMSTLKESLLNLALHNSYFYERKNNCP